MTFDNTVLHEFLAIPAFTPRWAPDVRGNCGCTGYRVCPALSIYWIYRTVNLLAPEFYI